MGTEVTSLQGTRISLADDALEEFLTGLRRPDIGGPDGQARPPFNAMHAGVPAVTATCSGTADVIDAVNFARDRGLAVAVRGGGHSIAGLSTIDGGVLIDLAPMRAVQVDPEQRIARVQGGALWADVDRETQRFGLVAPGGVVSDTGVAGLTLGGGYGWVRRKYGLSCDHLVEAQVVCADGQVRTASEETNPDLFWALRGGGGNFGIVTAFTFDLNPLGPEVAFSGVMYPIEELGTVMRGFRDYTMGAPDDVTSVIVTMTFPPDPNMPPEVRDRPVAIVGAVHAGPDVEAGLRETQPLRELGTVLADLSGPTPFVGVQTSFDPLFPRQALQAYWKSQYLDELPDEVIDIMHERAQDRPGPMTLVNMFHMGGAIARVDPEATAFATRTAPYMASIDGMWDDPAMNEEGVAWVRETWGRIREYGTGEVYLNFTGLADEAPEAGVDTAFGRNLRRLAEIKAKYDPENFFRVNNNIRPATA